MAGLGLILLVLAGGLTAAVWLNNTDATSVSALGYTMTSLSTGELFLFGALTGLVLGLGASMLLAGAARKRARRRGLKSQVKAVRSERENLAEENARLQDELDRERSARSELTGDPYPADDGDTGRGRHASDRDAAGSRGGLFRR